ncbi:long-chain-fatty-acid--CoA ligase [Nocardia sp. R6R-6]|uniref:long-chain-fatty-acid--CoA ligase n=1 Tax=Nocardia sp. R6R-6 TaxID=3459303 RepID=UPI00403DD29E
MQLTSALHRQLQQDPKRVSTSFGGRHRTAEETIHRVALVGAMLRSMGVGDGDRVGILASNSDYYHEILLGSAWAGAVFVPINTRWSIPEIRYALDDCGAKVLFLDDGQLPLWAELRGVGDDLKFGYIGEGAPPEGILDYNTAIAEFPPMEDRLRSGDDLAGIFYTGGTTGRSKGVMLSHRNLLTSAMGSLATGGFLTPRGVVLHAAPMFHVADICTWVGGLITGATHVIIPGFTPTGVLDAIENHAVTDVLLVPTMIYALLDSPDGRNRDLSSLKRLIYGAAPVTPSALTKVRDLFPEAELVQAYGMTELSPITTLLLPADHERPDLLTSAGRALPHSTVRIVDTDRGVELPRGEIGEIVSRGDHVMLGYWGMPEATAAAVRAGWMHSGDAGYMDDQGYVYVVDRLKDMIISGGENVYTIEVENALGSHPAVASSAVIGVPDQHWGERIHAFVVRKPGTSVDDAELIQHVRSLIAGYKVPRGVTFLDGLPLSGAGKILKRTLRDQMEDSAK